VGWWCYFYSKTTQGPSLKRGTLTFWTHASMQSVATSSGKARRLFTLCVRAPRSVHAVHDAVHCSRRSGHVCTGSNGRQHGRPAPNVQPLLGSNLGILVLGKHDRSRGDLRNAPCPCFRRRLANHAYHGDAHSMHYCHEQPCSLTCSKGGTLE
jgi:hypothetical protein